jgi:hypothetical protein
MFDRNAWINGTDFDESESDLIAAALLFFLKPNFPDLSQRQLRRELTVADLPRLFGCTAQSAVRRDCQPRAGNRVTKLKVGNYNRE